MCEKCTFQTEVFRQYAVAGGCYAISMKNTNAGLKNVPEGGEILLYAAGREGARLEVKLAGETVWLSLGQMVKLFKRDKSVISRHIKNIFKEGELQRKAVVADFATTAVDGKTYDVSYYNLDVVISVGYRVKSQNGTRFRIWAGGVLKKHLIEGYTVNHKLLAEQTHKLEALQKAIRLIQHAKSGHKLDYEEAAGLLDVIENYSYALGLLDDYDRKKLKVSHTSVGGKFKLTYEKVIKAVGEMRAKSGGSELFGREKDQSLRSSVATIYQTFSGKELYPSAEEKAANLLYFIVKNHSFIDGNKRMAAAVFLWFLEKNGLLYRADGSKRLADNALVALTLMIAESRPEEKDVIATLVVNLINKCN